MAPSFRRGQHVTIDEDGKRVEAVFVRTAEKHDGSTLMRCPDQTVANLSITTTGTNGDITIHNSTHTSINLIADLTGFTQ